MSDVQWTVGHIGHAAPQPQTSEKHEYLAPMRQTEGMSAGQKETVRRYNSMRDMLIKHGLMDDKA